MSKFVAASASILLMACAVFALVYKSPPSESGEPSALRALVLRLNYAAFSCSKQEAKGIAYFNLEDETKTDSKLRAAEWFSIAHSCEGGVAKLYLGRLFLDESTPFHDVERGISYLESALANGSSAAAKYLGLEYYLGSNLPVDVRRASHYFEICAEGSDGECQGILAELLFAYSDPPDYRGAFNAGITGAKSGDPLAAGVVSRLYQQGLGTPLSHESALAWGRFAAESKDHYGLLTLADAYLFGWGVAEDIDKAIDALKASAALGNTRAMTGLGRTFNFGFGGIPINHQKAAQHYLKALDGGNMSAASFLGQLYYSGLGVGENHHEAFRLFKLAADAGIAGAHRNLGLIYMDGSPELQIDPNFDRGEQFLLRAVNLGDSEAAYTMAWHYLFRSDRKKNTAEGYRLARMARSMGDHDGQALEGYCLLWGKGVQQSPVEGVALIETAAEADSYLATYFLGEAYFHGKGVKQDKEHAYQLFQTSLNSGVHESAYYLGLLHLRGEVQGGEQDITVAYGLFEIAARVGFADSEEIRSKLAPRLDQEQKKRAAELVSKYVL